MTSIIPVPGFLQDNPLVERATGALESGIDQLAGKLLPDGPIEDGVRLLAEHPKAGFDLGRSVLGFRNEHPKAAEGLVELGKEVASGKASGADIANDAVDLVSDEPAAILDAARRAIDFTSEHPDAVRSIIEKFLGD